MDVGVGVGFGGGRMGVGTYDVENYSTEKPFSMAAPSITAVQIVRGIGVLKGPREKAQEAKRARRSEIERLSRMRRNGQCGSMREEVERLERVQRDLISFHDARTSQQPHTRGTTRREQYLRAVTEVRRLRDEQNKLEDMLHQKSLLTKSFQETAATFVKSDMVTWDRASAAYVTPLTIDDAIAVMKESCEIAATFESGGPWQSTGGRFMGWHDKRKLIELTSTMVHHYSKAFPGRRAQALMETTWTKFCEEWFYQKTVVNSSTSLQLHVLQVLNDSIRVVRRKTWYTAMPQQSFHTVYMMFRIQTEDGFVICLKSINAPALQRSLGEHELWVDVFQWITFNHLNDDDGRESGCEVTFGGTLHSGVRSFALYWLIESALSVVRWETACVAPLFILPASNEKEAGEAHATSRHVA